MTSKEEYVLVDQKDRDLFIGEIDQNFSVIAPAGVGKTRAIVNRIINIASQRQDIIEERLPKLVVVTYTKKAANEMQQRARLALIEKQVSAHSLSLFNKVFFGTIHSFCMKLLRQYGFRLGLVSEFSLIHDIDSLWLEFVRGRDIILSEKAKHKAYPVSIEKVIALARKIKPSDAYISPPLSLPDIDINLILDYKAKGNGATSILKAQEELREWLMEKDYPLTMDVGGGKAFEGLWQDVFKDYWLWEGHATLYEAQQLSRNFQSYCILKGIITYDDMISLACELVRDSSIGADIRKLGYSVILDEAQDTDKEQFELLLGVAETENREINPGRFSMVGDPQQAIYSSRADLPTYLNLHKKLIQEGTARALTFSVTMRCDRAVVDCVNQTFPNVLDSNIKSEQVDFVSLQARPWAEEGICCKVTLEGLETYKFITEELAEAQLLAEKIETLGKQGLGVNDWHEVAILASRKGWLMPIANALEKRGIPCQVHSHNTIQGDNPAFAWFVGLMKIAANPMDSFEIFGVLREVYGLSDDAIAWYVRWWDRSFESKKQELHPLNILVKGNSDSIVGTVLDHLVILRQETEVLSLSELTARWIEATHLEERLKLLADFDLADVLSKLEQIKLGSRAVEEQGLSLLEWIVRLEEAYEQQQEEDSVDLGAVQLYTCHKSKGLEWPVVIVPYLFRSIKYPTDNYPLIYNFGGEESAKIAVSKHNGKEVWDIRRDSLRRYESERLLYVTATRARNKLIWVDDSSIYSKENNHFADYLEFTYGGKNRTYWEELEELGRKNFSAEKLKETIEQEELEERFELGSIDIARDKSKEISRVYQPSQFAKRVYGSDEEERVQERLMGLAYGNWWHGLMERMPWREGNEACMNFIQDHWDDCPLIERGQKEISLFQGIELFQQLMSASVNCNTEVPFLWKDERGRCYEGVVDMFVQGGEERFIIDWKTDLVSDISVLKEEYYNQIKTYKRVFIGLYDLPVRTYIYSTCLAYLVEVE